MFQLPKTPHRPTAQNRLPPSPRRKRLRDKHSSRSPPRLRGSRVYHRRAPKPRPAPDLFTQDASPAVGSNDSPDVTCETMNPSSPLDRYNLPGKTAYKQLMIDYVPSSFKLLSSPTSGNLGQSKYTSIEARSQSGAAPVPRRTKFAPPEEVDDGVFFSNDSIPSTLFRLFDRPKPIAVHPGPAITPTPKRRKQHTRTIPPLSFALDVDLLDLPSSYHRFQADSTTDDLPTNLHHLKYLTSLTHHAEGPALAYYID
jgi:hypothetical protein